MRKLLGPLLLAVLAACSAPQPKDTRGQEPPATTAPPAPVEPPLTTPTLPPLPEIRPLTEAEGQALVERHLPQKLRDRQGWAKDIHSALVLLSLPVTSQNICAVIGLAEQESGLVADPVVPNLGKIAFREIDRRRSALGIPSLLVDAALALESPTGVSYKKRLNTVKTERELSQIFEDFISNVPFGKRLFGRYNPVRTAGSMQVGIDFAKEHVDQKGYPYRPMKGSLRDEVFTRRGGVYFGTAYLLDYPANYPEYVFRFADFNAGRYSSRNAAFQQALGIATRRAITLDGDLLIYKDGKPAEQQSQTAKAAHALAPRLRLSSSTIDADLAQEKSAAFEQTKTYRNVFSLAEDAAQRPLPRAVIPQIDLVGPKIQRKLTTEWFAERVNMRFRNCLAR